MVYRKASQETGIEWNGREYNPDNFGDSNAVNMALSAAHACLYGIAHSVIVALGCSPGLGFVHTGHERSFVYDIADLYKAEITISIAFRCAAEYTDTDIGGAVRRAVRDAVSDGKIIERAAKDIRALFLDNLITQNTENEDIYSDVVNLWDEKNGFVKNAVSYGKDSDNFDDTKPEAGYGILLEDEPQESNEPEGDEEW
jgi:CRISPR-associated protein Cas1